MKKCIKCGAELNDDMLFCADCGTVQPKITEVVCPNCGEKVDANLPFCSNCGSSLTTKKTKKLNSVYLVICVLIFLVMLAGSGFYFYKYGYFATSVVSMEDEIVLANNSLSSSDFKKAEKVFKRILAQKNALVESKEIALDGLSQIYVKNKDDKRLIGLIEKYENKISDESYIMLLDSLAHLNVDSANKVIDEKLEENASDELTNLKQKINLVCSPMKTCLDEEEYAQLKGINHEVYTNINDKYGYGVKAYLHYTLDGSTPTIDSPILGDEGLELENKSITIKTITFSEYGIPSEELDYKIVVNSKVMEDLKKNMDECKNILDSGADIMSIDSAYNSANELLQKENITTKEANEALERMKKCLENYNEALQQKKNYEANHYRTYSNFGVTFNYPDSFGDFIEGLGSLTATGNNDVIINLYSPEGDISGAQDSYCSNMSEVISRNISGSVGTVTGYFEVTEGEKTYVHCIFTELNNGGVLSISVEGATGNENYINNTANVILNSLKN